MSIVGFRCIGWVDFSALLAPTGRHDPHAALLELLGEEVPDGTEARIDALLAVVARLEPRRLGLPSYALVRTVILAAPQWRTDVGAPRRSLPVDRALALLARSAGGIFLAGRAPRLAVEEWRARVHLWFAPVTGEAA